MAPASRPAPLRFRTRINTAMALYVALMLLVWPHVREDWSLPVKALLALTPVLPLAFVIHAMVERVRRSDEFQQRVHLLALGGATTLVGFLSLVGGFLAAAGVANLGGDVLIWVFPVLLVSYAGIRQWLAHRLAGGGE
jgi:hypothetical protein